MKNIPPIPSESPSQRLARETQERAEDQIGYNDVLQSFEGCESMTVPPRHQTGVSDQLRLLYRFPGGAFDSFIVHATPENKALHDKFFRVAVEHRDHSIDLAIMLGCKREQIANTPNQITSNTKAYIGDLVGYDDDGAIIPIFKRLPSSIEHIYTKFPEQRVRKEQMTIGGRTVEQLRSDLAAGNFQVYDNGLLDSDDFRQSIYLPQSFTTLKSPEIIPLVRFTVVQLGFPKGATTKEILERAKALGLELCPPEVGPYYRIQYTNQPMNEYIGIGMKPVLVPAFGPRIFRVYRGDDDSWLRGSWASPSGWDAGDQFLFRLGKSDF